jgi:cation-transporting ATPase E
MGTLNVIISIVGVIVIPLAILMFLNNYNQLNEDIASTVEKTAGSVIGMIPSGMFLLTSMALAVGVIKLAKKRTLVQDLYSIEMLARTDVLCLDKTGTITDGTMKVSNVIQIKTDFKYTIDQLVGSMLTALDDNNQTSRALITHFGYSKDLTPLKVLPFNSTRKLSAVTFSSGETFVLGAPEFVLKTKNTQVDNMVNNYASKGFRVLMIAECDGEIKDDKIPNKRVPIALIIIEDHIREDASETIAWFKNNGVEIKIISGDNPITVSEVSRRVGVENADKYISLEGLSQQQVIDVADKYTVFGRVSPEQKCILVKALKAKGQKVAMTGDGVNDILALKEADCSIAMASGSEATRLVSNLVLMDSNFASMPSVVAEGRRVINNVQKSSSLFLMKTIFTILLSIFCLIVKMDYPFTTKQVLMLEILVIGIPSFALALQPNNDKINGKFLANVLSKSLPGALILFLNVISCYLFDVAIGTDGEFQTMASLTITFVGLLVLYRLCQPFDIFRGIMFASMVTLCVVVLSSSGFIEFFEYVPMALQNTLFLICLVLASYPVYNVIVKWLDKIINFKSSKQ